jgi:hypothetical protein
MNKPVGERIEDLASRSLARIMGSHTDERFAVSCYVLYLRREI